MAGPPKPAAASPVATPNAPSVFVPLRFVLLGLVSLFGGTMLLVVRPDILATYHYNQYVVAATHLFVLGWILPVVMGAMYQLVPVALETRLFSERVAKWQFALHVVGVAGMIWMFWTWDMTQVGHFGSIVALSIGLFVYNLARTLRTIPRWNVVALGVASALFWLSWTAIAGLYVVAAKCWTFSPFAPLAQMHAHGHLGVAGVFLVVIVGVAYKLIPMFALSEIQNVRRAGLALHLMNTGLALVFLTVLLQSRFKPVAAAVFTAGLVVFGIEMRAVLRARKRRQLDWGLRAFLTALGFLGPLSACGLVLSWPTLPLTAFTGQLENLYGFLAIMGVVTFAILGMLYKIVPFIVWFARYSPLVGRQKVPALADLYSVPCQVAGYGFFLAGLLATSVAILSENERFVRAGCSLLALGLAVFAVNVALMLSHLVRPRTSASGGPGAPKVE